jgi:uncharacterized membrane protein YcjF (UPF0283 family)
MSYTEEIYERAEKKFTSDSAKLAWLSGFERPAKGKNKFTEAGVLVRDSFILYSSIKNDIPRIKNLKEVKNIQRDATRIDVEDLKDKALGLINEKIAVLEGEAEEEKRKFKEAELREEREKAQERLRELSPHALGGIKSGETRRGKAILKSEFLD